MKFKTEILYLRNVSLYLDIKIAFFKIFISIKGKGSK
jgi:hypothetical protein